MVSNAPKHGQMSPTDLDKAPSWAHCPSKPLLDGMAAIMVLTGAVTFITLIWGCMPAAYGRYEHVELMQLHKIMAALLCYTSSSPSMGAGMLQERQSLRWTPRQHGW